MPCGVTPKPGRRSAGVRSSWELLSTGHYFRGRAPRRIASCASSRLDCEACLPNNSFADADVKAACERKPRALTGTKSASRCSGSMQTPTLAFVGAGPTTIYTLNALLKHAPQCSFAITVFEQQPVAGRGSPYRPGWNDPAMLSNIAGVEIPPLAETLVGWLERQPQSRLIGMGIDPHDINDRAFYPRLALGEYLKDQFQALIERAERSGIQVDVRTRCRVVDAEAEPERRPRGNPAYRDKASEARFDHLVLATGHQWPEDPEVRPGYFLSPWPAARLAGIPASSVGVRGSSLSAIDAAVAVALAHGRFSEEGDWLTYVPRPGAEAPAPHDAVAERPSPRGGFLPSDTLMSRWPFLPRALLNT